MVNSCALRKTNRLWSSRHYYSMSGTQVVFLRFLLQNSSVTTRSLRGTKSDSALANIARSHWSAHPSVQKILDSCHVLLLFNCDFHFDLFSYLLYIYTVCCLFYSVKDYIYTVSGDQWGKVTWLVSFSPHSFTTLKKLFILVVPPQICQSFLLLYNL